MNFAFLALFCTPNVVMLLAKRVYTISATDTGWV